MVVHRSPDLLPEPNKMSRDTQREPEGMEEEEAD